MKKRTILGILLGVAFTLPVAGKGKPTKGETTPVIVVFRDADGDLFGSDLDPDTNGAYTSDNPGVAQAILDERGNLILDFRIGKGRKGATATPRQLMLNLTGNPVVEGPGDPPYLEDNLVTPNYLFVAADDGYGHNEAGGVRAVTEWEYARIVLFFYDPQDSRVQWKLSYSDYQFRTGDEGEGFGKVECWQPGDDGCTAWRIWKPEPPLAALLSFKENIKPDAGVWNLPFAVGVCVCEDGECPDAYDCRSDVGFLP